MFDRLLTLSFASVLLLGAPGCGGSEPEDTDTETGDDDDDTEDTGDTGTTGGTTDGIKDVGYLMVQAQFGWDGDNGVTVPVGFDGYQQASVILVYFGSPDWDFTIENVDEYCTAALDITGQGNAAWTTPDFWLGLDYQGGEGVHDCDDFDIAAIFGTPDPVEVLTQVPWEIGVGGELAPDLATQFEAAYGPEILDVVAGGWLGAGLVQQDMDAYTQAYEIDGSFNLATDGAGQPLPIDRYSMQGANNLATGFYVWSSLLVQVQ